MMSSQALYYSLDSVSGDEYGGHRTFCFIQPDKIETVRLTINKNDRTKFWLYVRTVSGDKHRFQFTLAQLRMAHIDLSGTPLQETFAQFVRIAEVNSEEPEPEIPMMA
jgi:hypothetical protein